MAELIAALAVGPTDPHTAISGYPLLGFTFIGPQGRIITTVTYLHSRWLYWAGWGRDRPLLRPQLLTDWLAERGWPEPYEPPTAS